MNIEWEIQLYSISDRKLQVSYSKNHCWINSPTNENEEESLVERMKTTGGERLSEIEEIKLANRFRKKTVPSSNIFDNETQNIEPPPK